MPSIFDCGCFWKPTEISFRLCLWGHEGSRPMDFIQGGGQAETHKEQGVFAQLVVADGAQLTEGPVQWRSEQGLTGVTLAPGVHYDKRTQELVVPEAGVYYVFLHLTLKRVMAGNRNGSDSISVALDLQPYQAGAALTLTLDLPPPPLGNSAAGFRSSLLHLDAGQRLSVHLRPRIREPLSWQLSAEATVWGLFRVATQVPSGLPLSKLT
ncbi:tumor necrosis factor ligand superfamily member 9 isoform X6 [Bos indicus x Bos taurus]|uniref:tumor necrosis factor ligand superfamily member 9 isoform X6 n=1 Tax=Bos indicus x Bos taurus TaxID=30522 RepID=UPI000F7D414F|nr:tumor necrosis factor ligand superfamily member 9 isoform X6 [Bos indicus x Bos taurus]